ncbi:protein GRAVITROPIC IN THE LIGHT 1-like [Macadamia integrifolia]|uniref:protein GRAVITROPIC IN THE LIGHT 1-like n=1 Tax=Macadamia integrifolia TaxID=60698 RepID=UPI001C4EA3F4|nr:protein GRAVITROPIC IN THE LIGHT 1-like [Macadamia integrifolia]
MESATKHARASSNISDIVHRFAKVCRLRSTGVFSGENPTHDHRKRASSTGDSSNTTDENEFDEQKIHPHPIEGTLVGSDKVAATAVIPKLFDSISALKLAYIQLQEAHIPFDSEKIEVADDLVVSQLKVLSDIKRSYKEKQITSPKCDSTSGSSLLFAEIQDHESRLEKLQSQIQGKDSLIFELRRELEGLDRNNASLEELLKRRKYLEEENMGPCRDLEPNSFVEVFNAASKSIHDFAKPLICLMKASSWDLDLAANSIEESVVYLKRSHKKYAFEAYLSRRMFHGFFPKLHNLEDITRFKDPFDALVAEPTSSFANFCRLKYLLVVHSKMEASFFGNLDQRTFVMSGKHPRTPLYQAFVKMAKWVWVLQGLAASVEDKAEIFGVQTGSEFSEDYMESVVEDEDDALGIDREQGRRIVGFMVMPGFRVGKAVIRSRVYLSKME